MKKHMMPRFEAEDAVLKADMESLAAKMDVMTEDDLIASVENTRQITELDHMISKIDALQAELWRRSQPKDADDE